jgi:hypothetical protein
VRVLLLDHSAVLRRSNVVDGWDKFTGDLPGQVIAREFCRVLTPQLAHARRELWG